MQNEIDSEPTGDFPNSVLIAGCGYLGRRAAKAWLDAGAKVYAITRNASGLSDLVTQGLQPIEADIVHDVPPLPAIDLVVWAVGFDRNSQVTRQQVWLDGLTNVIRSLSRSAPPSKMIYLSSVSVYGDSQGAEVDEFAPCIPTTESGKAVFASEQLFADLLSSQVPSAIGIRLRLAGIYGPDRLLRRSQDLHAGVPIVGNGNDWLNLVHVDDAVRVLMACAKAEHTASVINVVNRGTVNRAEYYRELAQLFDAPQPAFVTDSGAEPSSAVLQRRERSGNKRVVSHWLGDLPVEMLYDDVRIGLQDAVRRSINR